MKIKRILAFITDIFIISVISQLIFEVAFKNTSYEEYTNNFETYMKSMTQTGSADLTKDELIELNYNLNKSQSPYLIINLGLTVLYFGIISYLWNGKTLGKSILKIRTVPVKGKRLKPHLYMLREIIKTNSIFKLLAIINIMFASKNTWFTLNSVITNCETLVIVVLIGFLIFREDERSLHDILCQTNVIEEKKVE